MFFFSGLRSSMDDALKGVRHKVLTFDLAESVVGCRQSS